MLDNRYIIVEEAVPGIETIVPIPLQMEIVDDLPVVVKRRQDRQVERYSDDATDDKHLPDLFPVVPVIHPPYTYRDQEGEGHVSLHLPCPCRMILSPEARERFPSVPKAEKQERKGGF